jgi:hypothetical protein
MTGDRGFDAVAMLGRASEGSLKFGYPDVYLDGSGYVRIPVSVSANGVAAESALEFEEWGGGQHRVLAFLNDLAGNWRGWAGAKDWSDDHGTVTISATHDGVGTVLLAVSLVPQPGWDGPGSWTLNMTVAVDPGSFNSVANELRRLLDSHD